MDIGLKPIALALPLAAMFCFGTANAKVREVRGVQSLPAVKVSMSASSASRASQPRSTDAAVAESHAGQGSKATNDELEAATHGLESAAAWIGGKAKLGASMTVADVRALRARLISGAVRTGEDVNKGFAALDRGVAELDRNINSTKNVSPDKHDD